MTFAGLGLCLSLGQGQPLGQITGFLQLALGLLELCFQGGQLAGFVMAAAVCLLFQGVGGFGIGGVLLAGCNEGGDAPLQTGILADGESRLTDEGAALKDLPADPQQGLAAGLACQLRNLVAGAGVDCLKFSHGSCLPAGGPGKRELLAV